MRDYPYNLIDSVFGNGFFADENSIPFDLYGSVDYALSLMGDRLADILRGRYRDNDTLRALADKKGLSTERVRQIQANAEHTLRNPMYAKYIQYGVSGVVAKEREEAVQKQKKELERLRGVVEAVSKETEAERAMNPIDRNGYPVRDIPLGMLGLSTRARTALSRKGYNTLGEIIDMNYDQLKMIRNIGIGTIAELRRKANEYGFYPNW